MESCCPFVLVFMLQLVNKRELMGRLTNSRVYDVVAWGLTAIIVFLSGMLLISIVKNLTPALSAD